MKWKMVTEPKSDMMECKSYYTNFILCIEVESLREGNHISETLLYFCRLFGLLVYPLLKGVLQSTLTDYI